MEKYQEHLKGLSTEHDVPTVNSQQIQQQLHHVSFTNKSFYYENFKKMSMKKLLGKTNRAI